MSDDDSGLDLGWADTQGLASTTLVPGTYVPDLIPESDDQQAGTYQSTCRNCGSIETITLTGTPSTGTLGYEDVMDFTVKAWGR